MAQIWEEKSSWTKAENIFTTSVLLQGYNDSFKFSIYSTTNNSLENHQLSYTMNSWTSFSYTYNN